MVKKIRPHKGGRTERIHLRSTPETKEQLQKMADERGISTADLVEELVHGEKMRRSDIVTITEVVEVFDRKDTAWMEFRTTETGEYWFRVGAGIPKYDKVGYRRRFDEDDVYQPYRAGNSIRFDEMHLGLGRVTNDWLGAITPGVNLHIGLIKDFLWKFCGPLAFCEIVIWGPGAIAPPPEQAEAIKAVGYNALEKIIAGKESAAKAILEQSGLFTLVYQFQVPPPKDENCFEVEPWLESRTAARTSSR